MSVLRCTRCGRAMDIGGRATPYGLCIACFVTERTAQVDAARGVKPKRVVNHHEDDLQKQVCAFLDIAIRRPNRYWAVPNGGKRLGKEAARMAGLGVKPGVVDLHFAWSEEWRVTHMRGQPLVVADPWQQVGRSGFIELKALGWTPVPSDKTWMRQQEFLLDMHALGHWQGVATSLDEVVRHLTQWGMPLHAHL